MKCAVITPIGPGHTKLYEECKKSIEAAAVNSSGPFNEISIIPVDDSSGDLGRSAARNKGTKIASADKIEWIFFLDSDDIMFPDAFKLVEDYVRDYDAIWGVIVNTMPDSDTITLRNPQAFTINTLEELLLFDPFHTLQMGHFIRTEAASKNLFNESMNAGEDFDYYMRVWETGRCIKIPEPLFINRRGLHSTGARAATGKDWDIAAEKIIERYREKHGIIADKNTVFEHMKDNLTKYTAYLKSKNTANTKT